MQAEKKILYIDGDKRHRKKAKYAFSKEPYRCIICKEGEEGLKRIARERPDIVIVDYNLSDMTGEELYTQFLSDRHILYNRDVPFILLTNNGIVDKSKMYSLGFSACLGKPFKAKEISEFVEDVIVSHQLKVEETKFWETIRKAKDFLETVVESSVDAILTTDRKGNITYCNRATEEMLEYGFEELLGNRVNKYLKGGANELLQIVSMLEKRGNVENYKTSIITSSNQEVPINVSICSMKNVDGRVMGILAISKKLCNKDHVEYDSLESERLAIVVETAVAVNHAINNPLVPILGNAQFLLQDERIEDEDIRNRLRMIVKNAIRIKDITQKLARISHPVTKEYLRGTRMLDIEAST